MLYRAHSASVRIPLSRLITPAMAALLLGACGGNITNPFADEGRLESIAISGASVVQVGDTIRLSATGKVGGITGIFYRDRVPDARWTVSDPTIASVTSIEIAPGDTTSHGAVLVRGLRAGDVQVTATARRVAGSAAVHVAGTPPS